MTFHIITLFPHAFDSYLGESILKRAILDKKIKVKFYNPRDYAENKWRRIDRAPYGGGPGMVIQAEPVIRAIEAALKSVWTVRSSHSIIRANNGIGKLRIKDKGLGMIWLSPSGKQFTNETGVKLAKHKDIIIICGRYEGIDARVKKATKEAMGVRIEEISIGPFILSGGELPAEIIIDAVSRQVPGVLGNCHSVEEKRTASPDVYTRPEVIEYKGKKYRVPKILLTGHHKKIEEWRQKNVNRKT